MIAGREPVRSAGRAEHAVPGAARAGAADPPAPHRDPHDRLPHRPRRRGRAHAGAARAHRRPVRRRTSTRCTTPSGSASTASRRSSYRCGMPDGRGAVYSPFLVLESTAPSRPGARSTGSRRRRDGLARAGRRSAGRTDRPKRHRRRDGDDVLEADAAPPPPISSGSCPDGQRQPARAPGGGRRRCGRELVARGSPTSSSTRRGPAPARSSCARTPSCPCICSRGRGRARASPHARPDARARADRPHVPPTR